MPKKNEMSKEENIQFKEMLKEGQKTDLSNFSCSEEPIYGKNSFNNGNQKLNVINVM